MFPRTVLALLVLAPLLISEDWRDAGVLDLRKSPHARLHSVPVRAVTIEDGFWSKRRRVNVERSIPSLLALLEENGVVDNFRRLSGRKNVARRGPLYTDSDLYKWMEAVAFVLQSGDNPKLRAQFDQLTDEILAAQEPSGYLNTYFVEDRVPLRFQQMQSGHELYCLGHLLQAAIAYHRATGNRRLLDGALRFVEYLIRDFGPDKKPLLTGHPELELALVELYRTTGDRRHLDLAGYLLRGDGERLKLSRRDVVYLFSGKPFIERTKLEGHAVRTMYAASGATDYFIETGDEAYRRTLDRLWQDMTHGKMYITGGVGSRAQGEAFGEPYELPNRLAYTESCAAIGNMIWNWRLLAATGEARFADEIERALYNARAHRRPGGQNPQPLVQYHLLPSESPARAGLAARLLLQHQPGGPPHSSLRRQHARLATGGRNRAEVEADYKVPMGGHSRDLDAAGARGGVHAISACPGLGELRAGSGKWSAGTRSGEGRRISRDPAEVGGE